MRSTGRASLTVQLVELEDGRALADARAHGDAARATRTAACEAMFSIGLGVAAALAPPLAVARGIDLAGEATPIGLGCRACTRARLPATIGAAGGARAC